MNLDKVKYKNFEVNNHNEFILKLKNFKEKNNLIDNGENWINNNISPYSLGYVEKKKLIKISIWKIGKSKGSYFTYGWNLA